MKLIFAGWGTWWAFIIWEDKKVYDEDFPNVLDRAYSAIILSLEGVLTEVGGKKAIIGLQKKLKDYYTKKSMAKRLATKKKLYTL